MTPTPLGVRVLDIAARQTYGAASFSFGLAQRAMAAGYPPYTISTDLHVRTVGGPVHDLATTMSKLLALGMPLQAVVRTVTEAPASILGERDWCDLAGPVQRATLFRVSDHAGRYAAGAAC